MTRVPPSTAMAALAHAILPPEPDDQLGDITLRPHQRDAVARLQPILRRFHGALLADDVGLGKTYVALATARGYDHVHVIAPASLLPMWRTARTHAHTPTTSLHSLQTFSLPTTPSLPTHPNTLVIIDEAHLLRTPRTNRYRAIARAVAGADLLLISATPLHNTTNDLRHLLALFLGHRADVMTPQMLARTIVRRTQAPAPTPNSIPTPISISNSNSNSNLNSNLTSNLTLTPPITSHPPHTLPHDPETLTLLLALPAPLPAHDGTVAGALIRLGLLRAWCSSDAALTHALRQRRRKGEALRQALDAGRHPTRAELRTWLVGEHDVQLAFPELLAHHPAANTANPTDPTDPTDPTALHDTLRHHLDALAHLAEHHARTASADPLRAQTLRDILHQHPTTPVVAFSQFTQTVQALHRALADIAGVGLLTGRHARIASGPITRQDALHRFAPGAHGRDPPPPHHAIRLLLTTDLLAEGVNLQDAGVVVHLDLPWTHARLTQRTGRCTRIGSPHPTVHVHTLAPPPAIDTHLHLHTHLLRKAGLTHQLLEATPSPPAAATALHTLLHHWRTLPLPTHPYPLVAILPSPTTTLGWLATLHVGTTLRLVAGTPNTRPTTRVRTLLHLATAIQHAHTTPSSTTPPPTTTRHALRLAHRQLRTLTHTHRTRHQLGPTHHRLAPIQRQAHTTLHHIVHTLPPTTRHTQHPAITRAQQLITTARHAGAQLALRRWLATAHTTPPAQWLRAWEQLPELAQLIPTTPTTPTPRSARRPRARLHTLLLLVPQHPHPHGTTPTTPGRARYASACPTPTPGSPSSSISMAP